MKIHGTLGLSAYIHIVKHNEMFAPDKALYGHNDEGTAHVVGDYPYGFRQRTQIRYWMEHTARGDRFASQTLNPSTQKWNAPKKSTYSDLGVMHLDDQGHVTWSAIGLYTPVAQMQEFLAATDRERLQPAQQAVYDMIAKAVKQ